VERATSNESAPVGLAGTLRVPLAVGDTVDVRAATNSGTATVETDSEFAVEWIGE